MRPLAAVLIAVALLAAGALAAPRMTAAQTTFPSLFGGPFTLTDHDGRPVTDQSFAGRHMLVYFGYTLLPRCLPDRSYRHRGGAG